MHSILAVRGGKDQQPVRHPLAEGRLPERGFVRPEDVPLGDFLANRYGQVYAAEAMARAA